MKIFHLLVEPHIFHFFVKVLLFHKKISVSFKRFFFHKFNTLNNNNDLKQKKFLILWWQQKSESLIKNSTFLHTLAIAGICVMLGSKIWMVAILLEEYFCFISNVIGSIFWQVFGFAFLTCNKIAFENELLLHFCLCFLKLKTAREILL